MKDLFKHWDSAVRDLRGKTILLFLDYDGTLTPIVSRPENAALPDSVRTLLTGLLASRRFRIAIVSGRALADIKNRVGIGGIVYAANHGLEAEGPGVKRVFFAEQKFRLLLSEISVALKRIVAVFPGSQLEDKGLTLSIHYRRVDPKAAAAMRAAVLRTLKPYTAKNRIRLNKGKMVFEVRPPVEWNKGKFVMWLMKQWKTACTGGIAAVYLGDDVTDEDAFRALQGKGLTVFVGRYRRRSAADYFLRGPEQVRGFLAGMRALQENG